MFKVVTTSTFFLITLFPSFASAKETFLRYKNEYEIAYKEKEYAFRLIPEFYNVLSGKGYAPALNSHYITWKYRYEMQRRPDNPFLDFCIGELYRYKNKYKEAFKYYDSAITKAGTNIYKHTILLELFSRRKLLKWQIKEEEKFPELKKGLGALSLPLLSKYFFFRGKEAAQKGLENEIGKNIKIAEEMDPYNPGILLVYTRYLFLSRKSAFLDEFLSSIHLLFIDFKTKLFFTIFSYNFFFTLLTILLSSFVIAYFIKYFPFATSKIITLVPDNMSMPLRSFISITFLLLPIIWTFPSLWTFIFMLVVPIPFLERKERRVVQSLVLMLFILSFLGGFQTRAFTGIDPTQKIGLLDSMQKSRFKPRWISKCDSLISVAPKDFSTYFLKGLQLKRGGFFAEAEKNYRKAMGLAPNFYQTYNNLGNVLFWKGEVDSSIKYYELAMEYKSKSPAPHYNLSQAYVRKFQFNKSSLQMKIASQLDFDLISNQTMVAKERNNHFLIDLILPQEMLWGEFFSLKEDTNIFPWKYLGINYRNFSIVLICLFLLYIIIPRITKHVKYQCPICSSPISKGNSQRFEKEDICWRCYNKLIRIHSLDIKERLKDKIKTDSQRTIANIAIFWGLFLPGLGHIYIGKIKTGVLYLLFFSILCSMLLINRVTKIRFYLPFLKATNLGLYIIITVIVLLYLVSLLSLFGSFPGEKK